MAARIPAGAPLVVSMDDSLLRKTGRKVHGVAWKRDPMSPPFHVNFVRGVQVLQISAAITGKDAPGEARMVPVDFIHVPSALPPPKWRKNDTPRRASTASLINQLRYELWGAALGAEEGHFSGFTDEPSRETKPEKYLPNLAASVLYAVN